MLCPLPAHHFCDRLLASEAEAEAAAVVVVVVAIVEAHLMLNKMNMRIFNFILS